MAPPQKEPLRPLTAAEYTALEEVANATSERVDRVRRAPAVLAVAQGQAFRQATQQGG